MDFQAILNNFVSACVNIAWKLLAAALVLIIGNIVIHFIMKYALNSKCCKKMDETVRSYLRSLIKAGLNIIFVVIVVGILGIPMASVIAVIAAAGAAIALALQGSLSNLAGGIMLLIFRPFSNGQYIETNSFGGTVHDIGLFYTTLITPDHKQITIPNATLTTDTITNYSTQPTRRVDVVYNVAYGTDLEQVKKVILDYVEPHSQIMKDPAPFIRMTEMADSSIKFTLRVWCDNANYWNVKFDLTEGIYDVFRKENISIPFPQMDIHVMNEGGKK